MNAETYEEETKSKCNGQQMITRMFKDEDSAKEWVGEVLNERK